MEGAATTVLPAPARARGRLAEPGALRSAVMACYGVLGALLAAYIASVLVGHPHGQLWETLNNWPLDSCEVLAAISVPGTRTRVHRRPARGDDVRVRALGLGRR